ncbi:hypothetical protein [Parabacteroides faecis]|nr:hypothetical protein [Parabacteroides faecis]
MDATVVPPVTFTAVRNISSGRPVSKLFRYGVGSNPVFLPDMVG